MPSKPKNTAIIEFDSNSFFALSWLIVELGELKDVGLKVQKLADAIFIVEDVSREQSLLKAINALRLNSDIQNTILKKASQLTEIFIVKDKINRDFHYIIITIFPIPFLKKKSAVCWIFIYCFSIMTCNNSVQVYTIR